MDRPAVVFDLYETLVTEFTAEWTPEPPTLAQQLGLSEEAFDRGWQRVRDARMRGIVDFPEALRAICRFGGVAAPSSGLLDDLLAERLYKKAAPFRAVDGEILKMLALLKSDLNARLCLMTNASEEETRAWHSSELAGFFDAALFSYEVGHLKPEHSAYDAACSALGARPERTVFVGDGGADELEGAAAAGLTPLWATWFLDRWPFARHAYVDRATRFVRLTTPEQVVSALTSAG